MADEHQPEAPSPVILPNAESRHLRSAIVGDTYRLDIALPGGYARSARAYPVVYLTDGDVAGLFPLVRCIAEGLSAGWMIPKLILVGIGYEAGKAERRGHYRERDFLPTDASARDPSRRQATTRIGVPRGQAAAFLRFIRQELKPFIDAHYRTLPDDSTYMGTSYGGLFGLYTLFHQPNTFQRYILGSPAIHHDDRVILAHEGAYAAQHTDLPARVFLGVGGREELDDPLIEPGFQFVTNLQRLAGTLQGRNYPGLRLTSHVFEDETHVSVVPALYSRGPREVFDSFSTEARRPGMNHHTRTRDN
jgi:predicted alpha/beta superfamily hydrolase